jgi:heme A synthase
MGLFKRRIKTQEPKLPFMNSIIVAFLRHILTFIGGTIVSKGLLDEATMLELIGAAISFISVSWMTVDKIKKKQE